MVQQLLQPVIASLNAVVTKIGVSTMDVRHDHNQNNDFISLSFDMSIGVLSNGMLEYCFRESENVLRFTFSICM